MVMVILEEKVELSKYHQEYSLFFRLLLGFLSKLERATHIDFNGDNIIGRPPDIFYGYPSPYAGGYGGYPSMGYGGYGGFPSMGYGGYGGYPSMGYGGHGHGPHHHHGHFY
jgi:hypothetical protein